MLNTQKLTNLIRGKSDICEKESYHETGPADLLLICPYLSVLTFLILATLLLFQDRASDNPRNKGPNVGLMLDNRLRRWLDVCHVFGKACNLSAGYFTIKQKTMLDSVLIWGWATVYDGSPTSNHHWSNVLSLLSFLWGGGGGAPSPRPLSDEISVTYLSNIHAERSLPSWVFLAIQFPRRWSCPDKTVPPCFSLPRPPPPPHLRSRSETQPTTTPRSTCSSPPVNSWTWRARINAHPVMSATLTFVPLTLVLLCWCAKLKRQ